MKGITSILCLMIFSVLSITSCDCMQRIEGTIVDDATGKPIYNATVWKKDRTPYKTTDSTGRFEISTISGGLLGCPAMKVIVYADGYTKTEANIPAGGSDVIRLKHAASP